MDLRGATIHSGGPELKTVGGLLTDAHVDRRIRFDGVNGELIDGQKKRRKLPEYMANKIGQRQLWVVYGEVNIAADVAAKFVPTSNVVLEFEDFYFLVTKLKSRNLPSKNNLGMPQNLQRVTWAFCGVCNPSEKQLERLTRLQDKKTVTDYFIDTTKTLFEMSDAQTISQLQRHAEQFNS